MAVTATVLPQRAKDTPVTWSAASDLVTLSSTSGNTVTISGNNKSDRPEYVTVKAMAANGFYATVHVFVEPRFLAAPLFTKKPVIEPPANGTVRVDYALDLGGRQDQSLITWYECADAQCTARRKGPAVTEVRR